MSIDLDDLARKAVASPPTRVPALDTLRMRIERRRRNRMILAGMTVAPVIAIAAIGTWALISHDDATTQVVSASGAASEAGTSIAIAIAIAVPDVVGLTIDEAIERVEASGLTGQIVEVAVPEAALSGVVAAIDPVAGSRVTPGTTITLSVGVAPSQSAADAARDQILPELARLPTSARIRQVKELFGPTRLETAVGTWVISQPNVDLIDGITDGCTLGDPGGIEGLDRICIHEYAEILLLDTKAQIVRAYPFPGLGPLVEPITLALVNVELSGN